MKRITFLPLCIIFVAALSFAGSKSLEFAWDYGTPPDDLAGFRIYASETSDSYEYGPNSADLVGELEYTGQTDYTLTESMVAPDNEETTYYFVATAFDDSGNESGSSNEVSAVLDFLPPDIPITFTVTISVEPQ